MSQEAKTVCSSETPEADTSASESRPASGSSSAVTTVRTLQDVEREIQKQKAQLEEANKKYQQALSFYTAAFLALKKEPNNETLSKELADAAQFVGFAKGPADISAQRLASLEAERAQLQAAAERAQLQAAADRASEQKSLQASEGFRNLAKILQRPVEFRDDETKLLKVWTVPRGIELPFLGAPDRDLNPLVYRNSHSPLISLIFEEYRGHCSRFNLPDDPVVPDAAVVIDESPSVAPVPDGGEHKSTIVPVANNIRRVPIKIVVKGPPGQGKSVFLNIILIEAFSKGIPVVCQKGTEFLYVFTRDGVRMVPYDQRQTILELDKIKNKDSYKTIYLYDPSQGNEHSLNPNLHAFTVVASSPNVKNYLSIDKMCTTFYVYPWTKDELKALAPLISPDITYWLEREQYFLQLGYSLRLLLAEPRDFPKYVVAMEDEIKGITLEELEKAILAVKTSANDKSEVSHKLVTYAPKDGKMDFRTFELVPVTPEIRIRLQKTFAVKATELGKNLWEFVSVLRFAASVYEFVTGERAPKSLPDFLPED